jgi:hypothetical protein
MKALPASLSEAILEIRASARRALAEQLDVDPAEVGGCQDVAPLVAHLLDGLHVSGWRADGDDCVDHHWVELTGGVVCDPTADQFDDGDVPDTGIALIAPGHPDHWRYREYGDAFTDPSTWQGDDPSCLDEVFGTAGLRFYHVAPVAVRQDILRDGLLPHEPDCAAFGMPGCTQPEGVYLWADRDLAHGYAVGCEREDGRPRDVWEVTASIDDAIEDDMVIRAWYVERVIEPTCLRQSPRGEWSYHGQGVS